MAHHIEIPDSVAGSLRLPEQEIDSRLRMELAIALYAQGILSFGKASELANLARFFFADQLLQRNVPRHYGEEEVAQDLNYARSE